MQHRWIRFFLALLIVALPLSSSAESKEGIDSDVKSVLKDFSYLDASNKELLKQAVGVLVFPSVIKAGFVVGGEYGEGALQIEGKTVSYYSIASASVGLQLGAQSRAEIILFMDKGALEHFRNSDGWRAGVDGSIAVIDAGAGKGASSDLRHTPIIAFVLLNKGLMGNISLEGSKISKIER